MGWSKKSQDGVYFQLFAILDGAKGGPLDLNNPKTCQGFFNNTYSDDQ